MQDRLSLSAGGIQQIKPLFNEATSKIMVIVAGIKGAFIYHLCFVVLSILHHRDKEQRTEMGRRTKK